MTALTGHFTGSELETIRSDTPGLSHRIHLDNCGSALMSCYPVAAMQHHLGLEIELGGYVAQEQQSEQIAQVYHSIAHLFGGESTDYAFTGSAVDAWTKAFYSVPMARGDNIVTAYNEYCSNYVAYLHRQKRDGIEIRVAPATEDGLFDMAALEALVDDTTKLISITHVPSSSGQIAPVKEVGDIARRHDKLFLLDVCQAVGQLVVDFTEIGCDMATATGRKFLRGPRGIGFLYINERARRQIDPIVVTNQAATWTETHSYELRSDAGMFEAWERSIVNLLGFGAALDYIQRLGMERIEARMQVLSNHLRAGLAAIPNISNTCPQDASAAIITFNKTGISAAEIKEKMAEKGVATQVASVLHTRLDLEARGIETTARISPHVYNSIDELDRFLNLLEDI